MVNVFLFFIFSTKRRTNIEISTSHLFIFTLKLKNSYMKLQQLHKIYLQFY